MLLVRCRPPTARCERPGNRTAPSRLRGNEAACSSSSSTKQQQQQQVQQQQQESRAGGSSRRQVLQQACLVLGGSRAGRAAADAGEDLERQLPGLPSLPAQELPKPYQRTMRQLVKALRSSIEAEAEGAKEFEVRRKADPAKDLVKEFVRRWQDDAAVAGDVTHEEMKGALSELGRFYQKNGPRSRLSEETKDSVLAHLAAIEAALPEEPKSLLGL